MTAGDVARVVTGLRGRGLPDLPAHTPAEVTKNMSNPIDDRQLCQLILDQVPDAVIYADSQGRIRVWNEAAAKLFGYQSDEAFGASLEIIIPDHLTNSHWRGFDEAVASGHTQHAGRALKTRAVHKGGGTLYVSMAFSLIKDREGHVMGAAATARAFVPAG